MVVCSHDPSPSPSGGKGKRRVSYLRTSRSGGCGWLLHVRGRRDVDHLRPLFSRDEHGWFCYQLMETMLDVPRADQTLAHIDVYRLSPYVVNSALN